MTNVAWANAYLVLTTPHRVSQDRLGGREASYCIQM
jgi:hypothetical protein